MQQQPIRGLILVPGVKTAAQWSEMSPSEKVTWLAPLTPLALRGQASILAVVERRDVPAVLADWANTGLITARQQVEALAARPNPTRGGEAA